MPRTLHVAGAGDWVRVGGNGAEVGMVGAPGREMAVAVRPQLVFSRKGHSQISFTKACLTQQKSRQRY